MQQKHPFRGSAAYPHLLQYAQILHCGAREQEKKLEKTNTGGNITESRGLHRE
jgi:hypothetical protein